ncbi:hypothetical protein Tco_1135455 [Tanacetum coccineum]
MDYASVMDIDDDTLKISSCQDSILGQLLHIPSRKNSSTQYQYSKYKGNAAVLKNKTKAKKQYSIASLLNVNPQHYESIFSSCYLFHNSFSSTTMGDENPIRTLGDYSKPSHEGYRNTIELLVGNNVALLEDLSLYDNESWNDPRDFSKPVKEITLLQDVPSTSDRRLIELENQVQRLMEAHLALTQPTQVNKITTSCEICSSPHDTQYCMEDPEQAFVEYASSRTDEVGGKWYTFKPEQNNLGDTYNPSWRSHPNLSSINTITIHPKQQSDSHNRIEEKEEDERGNPEKHPDSPTSPVPSISFITEKVLKFNSLFKSLGLVPPYRPMMNSFALKRKMAM